MLHIDVLNIKNFRNHSDTRLGFKKGVNVIWGENGSGKTAVLEAIYSLSMGRSFRTRNHKETLKENEETLSLTGVFFNGAGEKEIQLRQIKSGKRKFFINKRELQKTKDLIGHNPTVLLSPEEQIITNGTPTDIRAFFDKVFSTISPNYLNALIEYQKTLKQRNTAIRNVLKKRAGKKDIEAWNDPVVNSGKKVWKEKKELLSLYCKHLLKLVDKYRDKSVNINIDYEEEGPTDTFEERLKKTLNSDLTRGYTTTGPHRDNYHIFYNEKLLKKYGSQGEHKIALVLMKMAESNTIKHQTGKTPILLLDDVFAKLDFQRADDMLFLLKNGYQTIITTTDIVRIEDHGIDLSSPDNTSFYLERACKA